MSPEQVKHLEFIQAVVTRMASNSFLLKGWSVTLSVALLGLAAKDANLKFAALALFPALSFWAADAYYLRQERLFRRLYDHIRSLSDAQWRTSGNFSMSTTAYNNEVESWFATLFAPAVCGIHLVVFTLVVSVLVFLVIAK